ncbi:hypothetical protein AM493_14555 [Flavobacterium akiainvivens]|uniref:Uncharacterized protein n=1 Tax=Flavobacterium akiainvivens TaxID=1202724 RepID=A0A0M8MAN6_9FLAO|nr:tetratricopeptide repeat protein [Flavobacterium akiainvivens]KOS07123.1 hypothetical protein AM493_14555 [Flavobacterium akiainvivens]SFQ75854.1 Tetratricopeptide repeat-containing protein [Flavobacterium akiainvivens]
MKNFLQNTVCALALLVTCTAIAQDAKEDEKAHKKKIEKIAGEACICTYEISTNAVKDSIVAKINSCITASIVSSQMGAIDEMAKVALEAKGDTVVGENTSIKIYIDQDFDEIQAYMSTNCEQVRSLLNSNDVKGKYSMSKDKKALEYYYEGNDYMTAEKYDLAIVSFNKAVKRDKKFAFAWDNLGICYRRRGNYQEAVKCYEKSLEIDPDGSMPLQNLPVAYEYLKQYDKAIECFEKIIQRDAKNPEGYFGAGRMWYASGDFEKATDNMFKAYRLYQEVQSPYLNDALQNLRFYYQEMEKAGKLDVFKKVAENNGINMD